MSTDERQEIAARVRLLRETAGLTESQIAQIIGITVEEYRSYESGDDDFPISYLFKAANIFDTDLKDILEGSSPQLSLYEVTKKGGGLPITRHEGFTYYNLAPAFKDKTAEPFRVVIPFCPTDELSFAQHEGHELDIVISGTILIQINDSIEILKEGDTIYYDSGVPHAIKAIGGRAAEIYAVVLKPENGDTGEQGSTYDAPMPEEEGVTVADSFIETETNEKGVPTSIKFKNADRFNFAFDCVDKIAEKTPDKTAMLWVGCDKTDHVFTFADMKKYSAMTANYFESLGIKRGDKVMLVLKRHYQFWFCMLALHRIGAIAIPATNQLVKHDFEYRFKAADVKAIVCTSDGTTCDEAQAAAEGFPDMLKILVGGKKEGWRDFNGEMLLCSDYYPRKDDTPCGNDTMFMLFTSGTTGYPRIAEHAYTYALGHYLTARYWHNVKPDGLHFTISDTGWGKALWGKIYGQWLCEAAIFTYDFDRFHPDDILPMFAKYNISTFCAPPTMYRFFIKEDLSKYDLSSIQYATTAGEALNPEVCTQFYKATGLRIMEGYGQTETTLVIGNFTGTSPKMGSMGKASPQYDVHLLMPDDTECSTGETGEICIRTEDSIPVGLFKGYYNDSEKTNEAWHNGYYHTGDQATRDEHGRFWYVGRIDDVIKSSGYRIGPFEIESVIMELPYVLECAITGVPDPVRGQIVKATIVLTRGTVGSDEMKKEIQTYVKSRTAPYKYPRIVEFTEELPKTISGKVRRVEIRQKDAQK